MWEITEHCEKEGIVGKIKNHVRDWGLWEIYSIVGQKGGLWAEQNYGRVKDLWEKQELWERKILVAKTKVLWEK